MMIFFQVKNHKKQRTMTTTTTTVTGSMKQAGDTCITPDGRHMLAVKMPDGLMEVELVQEIDTGLIDPSPINRDDFDPDKASDMEDSLRENGQIMPGIVRPKAGGRYELVAGERRWRGCVKLGIPKLKAMVRDYTDSQAAEILLFENLEREDLKPLQEARIYQKLLDLKSEEGRNLFTLETIAERRFGDVRKLSRVARVLKLNALPEGMKKALKEGVIKLHQAFLVARIADPKDREKAGKEVLSDQFTGLPMTVEKATRHIAENYQVNIQGAKFDREDADILSAEVKVKLGMTGKPGEDNDGSCARCPHLAKNNPAFAGELAVKSKDGKSQTGIDPNTCTRAMCHGLKLEALWHIQAVAFAKRCELPEGCILPLSEGGKKSFWVDGSGKMHLAGGLRDYVLVDEKITADELDIEEPQMPVRVPTWGQIMKGCEVPYKIVAGPSNEPLLIAERKLAITAGKQTRPELFATVEVPETKTAAKERTPQEIEAAKLAKQAQEREEVIKKEVRADTLHEVLERVTEKGLGVDGIKILCRAAWRNVTNVEELYQAWMGEVMPRDDGHDKEVDAMTDGRSVNGLLALLSLLIVGDDVMYSYTRAEDFSALCDELKVDPKAVEKRVRKAYEIADKAAAKEAAAADKAKMKSKGKDRDSDHATELVNADLATADILAKGDQERLKAPSHGVKTVWQQLMAMEPVESEANDHDVFEIYERVAISAGKGKGEVSICLAKRDDNYSASFEWDDPKSANKNAGGANPDTADLMPTKAQALLMALNDSLQVTKASETMQKVQVIVQEAIQEGTQELHALIAKQLEQVAESLVAGELSFEEQVKAVADGAKPSEFIGAKPKDAAEYKVWNAARMKLERAAAKLKKGAA